MAFKGTRQIYETAFDSKVEKENDDSGALIDRIANHPILQLLHIRRRSKHSLNSSPKKSTLFHSKSFVVSTSGRNSKQQKRVTPEKELDLCLPSQSTTSHFSKHRLRPIGLSKSDDEILNRATECGDEEDILDDYIEGSRTEDLLRDLRSFPVTKFKPIVLNTESPNPWKDAVHSASAHTSSSDKCRPFHSSVSRPFTSSLCRLGSSKVQPQRDFRHPRVKLLQGELSKSQALPLRESLSPLRLHSPPGTAPLPVKFKKTPSKDKSPSSWFSPFRQRDVLSLNKPYERASSITDSLEVLDGGSRSDIKNDLTASTKYSSNESVPSGMSSMESLRSSMSDGNKSTISSESAISSYKSSAHGSDSSLARPFLNLGTPRRSIIQSAKFQILSPISDKSQEPSYETAKTPQDLLELSNVPGWQKPSIQSPRNIPEDFRNIHHILPGPPSQGQPGSDSGISIEYRNAQAPTDTDMNFSDLPFDMPKLRRKLAAAKTNLSSSVSSISSSATGSDPNPRLSLPAGGLTSLNPAISRLQISSARSQTSSSNSSDWEIRSSAESSDDQNTPKRKKGLALELGCSAMSIRGESVDVGQPLAKQLWYHGGINRIEAENILRNQNEGSYLVRSIDTTKHQYSLALKSARGFMHLRLHFQSYTGCYTIGRSDKQFLSVPHIINHYSTFRIPIKGAEHMVLLHPIPIETL